MKAMARRVSQYGHFWSLYMPNIKPVSDLRNYYETHSAYVQRRSI